MKKTVRRKKAPARKPRAAQQDNSERDAILDERHDLQKLFPGAYNPQISIFTADRVEVMLTMSRAQAEGLARLLKEHKV